MLRSLWDILRARLALAVVTGGLVLLAMPVWAADHRDGPKITDRNGDLGSLDLNDLYVFVSPTNSDNSVFILTMGPGAGIVGPSIFFPGAVYELHISNDGNDLNLTEIVFRVVFSNPNSSGQQGYNVTQLIGGVQTGLAFGVTNTSSPVNLVGGGKVTAGIFDDPFFFDVNAVARVNRELTLRAQGYPTSGGVPPADLLPPNSPPGAVNNPTRWLFPPNFPSNFFGGFNTLAIVFEVPRFRVQSSKNNPNISLFQRVVANAGDGRGFAQYDRTAIPSINTVVIPLTRTINKEFPIGGFQDQFNFLLPSDDIFLRVVASDRLQRVFGLPKAKADGLAVAFLPDVTHFNTTSKEGFPNNGRQLMNDVIDTELGLLTNNAVTSDRVGNDSFFRATFPYIGTPNPVTKVLRENRVSLEHMLSEN
jgi:hypothetical protein